MICVSQEEAVAIRERLRNVNVTTTGMQHKSRGKKYWVEETPYVLRFLDRLRSRQKIEHYE